ncbi:MAG: class I SAM-dependent methyltransferase [Actinomycetia bacterium]|nr:class I SAM-dependent methyltransferase [Actinomycetes bacterium]
MDGIKKHFEDEAKEFDEIIPKLIPYYTDMIFALVGAIPFDENASFKLIDLGCGTGNISLEIKKRFPQAKITCVDIAENMLEKAKVKLKHFNDVEFFVGEFTNFNIDKKFDIAASSLAIHHLTDEDKYHFFQKIFESLLGEGVFIIADVILGSNDFLTNLYISKWKDFMKKSIPEIEIENKWMKKYKKEDIPSKLTDQLNWLKKIGFKDIDIIWKYYNFAVFSGNKMKEK